MNTATLAAANTPSVPHNRPHLDQKPSRATIALFIALLVCGIVYTAFSLSTDVTATGAQTTTYLDRKSVV